MISDCLARFFPASSVLTRMENRFLLFGLFPEATPPPPPGMDWLQFIASISASVFGAAWPITFLSGLILFRRQIRFIIRRVKKIGGFGASAEMIEDYLEEGSASGEMLTPDDDPVVPTVADTAVFERLLEISPAAAIAEKWKSVENWIAAKLPTTMTGAKISKLMARPKELLDFGIFDLNGLSLLNDLRAIRNAAAHETPGARITKQQAVRFAELADTLMTSKSYGAP